jgi:CBS domain-containing protein
VIEMLMVRDVMTQPVVTVRRETPLKDVARVLIDAGISGVPVVDDHGGVLGVVSEADFLIKGQGPQAIRHRRLARLIGDSRSAREQLTKVAAHTAGDAMSTPAVTVAATCSLQDAAAVMTRDHVNRLPVVEGGRLVGLVTGDDFMGIAGQLLEERLRG